MKVRAASPEEALRKVKMNRHDDITWANAELVDWEEQGEPKEV